MARGRTVRVTVLGTTDLHGNVYNWDYFKNKEFDNSAHDIGLAKVTTLIKGVRADRKGEPLLTLDAGDTIQGTPLVVRLAGLAAVSGEQPIQVDSPSGSVRAGGRGLVPNHDLQRPGAAVRAHW